MSRGHLAATLAAVALFLAIPSVASAQSFPLVGWWPLNEGSGQTVRDWSGKGNNGYLGSTPAADVNDPSWVRGVFLGSALRFTDQQFVSVPSASKTLEPANLTVAAWVKADTSPGPVKYIVSKGAAQCLTASYGLYTGAGGGVAFYIADGVNHYYVSPEASASLWDGKWHHVAGTFDGKAVRLFVDGDEVGNGTPASGPIDYDLENKGALLGNYAGCSNSLTFAGDVDGVQIWSTALPVDRIWAILKPIVTLAR